MGATAERERADALARTLIDGAAAPEALPPEDRRSLAWALKDACYAAWTTEPQRASHAAAALQRLRDAGPADAEIAALADWTAGIACLVRGEMPAATAQFERAGAQFRAQGAAHHAAETQVPNIMALAMQGRHAEAAACALATQRELVAQGDIRTAGKVSLNLGSLHLRQEEFRDAATHYREAAVLFARAGDREHSVMADIALADALTALADFDEATRVFARARMRAVAHGLPVLEAMVEESVALLELARGRYREALAGFEASRHRYEALAMPQHLAIAEKQLADAYLELNLLPEASALYAEAQRNFDKLGMPDDAAWTDVQAGRAYLSAGDAGAASEALTRAAAAFADQGNDVGAAAVALARAELALLAADAGAAIAHAESAERGFDAAGLRDRAARAATIRAHALLAAGRIGDAQAQFDATLATARALQLLSVEVRCLTGRGLAAQARGDAPFARDAFAEAIARFEEQRRSLPGDEIRSAFLTDHLRPYQALLAMALDEHERAPSAARAAEVLRQHDRLRARALGERLDRGADAVDAAADTPLRARLNWLHRRVATLADEGEASAALTGEIREIERTLLERARRRRLAESGAGHEAETGEQLDVGALMAALGDDDALVAYGVSGDELYAAVVARGEVTLHRRLGAWPAVREAAQAARFQFDTLRHGSAPVARHLDLLTRRAQARMQALHALLWSPIAGRLAAARRVLVVPHGELGTLPFAALTDGADTLGERIEIALAPSAKIAARGLRARPAIPRSAVVLAESTRLPHARAEAEAVAAIYADARVLVDAQATLPALRTHAAAADVLHFACHGQYRADNPAFSALHLCDGALSAETVESLPLPGGVVVLSACETALAENRRGDEQIGLVRAFLVAGAARVVASLWPVDDAITAGFMAHFHRALAHGAAPGAALALAQRELRRTHPHPGHWAAFVLYGGW